LSGYPLSAERGGMVSNSRRVGKAPRGMAIDRPVRLLS